MADKKPVAKRKSADGAEVETTSETTTEEKDLPDGKAVTETVITVTTKKYPTGRTLKETTTAITKTETRKVKEEQQNPSGKK